MSQRIFSDDRLIKGIVQNMKESFKGLFLNCLIFFCGRIWQQKECGRMQSPHKFYGKM